MISPDTSPDTELISKRTYTDADMAHLGRLLIEGIEVDIRQDQPEFFPPGPLDVTGTEFD